MARQLVLKSDLIKMTTSYSSIEFTNNVTGEEYNLNKIVKEVFPEADNYKGQLVKIKITIEEVCEDSSLVITKPKEVKKELPSESDMEIFGETREPVPFGGDEDGDK